MFETPPYVNYPDKGFNDAVLDRSNTVAYFMQGRGIYHSTCKRRQVALAHWVSYTAAN